jgi:hypothetical protein
LVNPNPGEAAKLPKNRFEQKWVKFVMKERIYRKESASHKAAGKP